MIDSARYSNKRRTVTENNSISAAALIWVFTSKRPTFVTALDIRNIKTTLLEK